jgi:hypothetical protein
MTGFMEDTALRMAGLDDNDIALLNKELPDLENLITVVQNHMAQIDRVAKLLPVLKKVIDTQRQMT